MFNPALGVAEYIAVYALLALMTGYAILVRHGLILRRWIEEAATSEAWGSGHSASYITTASLWFALGWDVMLGVPLGAHIAGLPLDGWGPIEVASMVAGLGLLMLGWLVAAFDRPHWALPPWYREWRTERRARGRADHLAEVYYVAESRRGTRPYVIAMCSCEWSSTPRDLVGDDVRSIARACFADARQHSPRVSRRIRSPLDAAPAELEDALGAGRVESQRFVK